jgi:hypothetical protein
VLTDDQVNEFNGVAKALYEDVPESHEQLRSLQKKAGATRTQVSRLLQEGAYHEAAEEHIAALDEIVLVVVGGLTGLNALSAITLDTAPAPPPNEDEPGAAPSQIVVPNPQGLILSEAVMKLNTAVVLLTLCDLLEAYVDVGEAFLGRSAGDRKVGRRIANAAGAVFLEVVTPPGVDAVIEVARQLGTSPLDEDISRMRAARTENERVESLGEALGHLHDQADVMGPGVKLGVDGATEARTSLVRGLRELRHALDEAAEPPRG